MDTTTMGDTPPVPTPGRLLASFHWIDYLLFGLSMTMSVCVGLFFAIKDKWGKQSSESYFMADRKMNFVLVGLSFLATAQTANIFVGVTAEFYYFGSTLIWGAIGYIISAAITAIIVIPKCFMLGYNVTSIYEYFEHRFGFATRLVAAFLYLILSILFMAVVLYIPSLVLESVSSISIFWCIFIGASVCCTYTAFGGMKAVIWVDSIQVVIIMVSMSILAGKGTSDAGGISAVWEKYSTIGERNNWDIDIKDATPWNRTTLWSAAILLGINLAAAFCASQDTMQRFMTVPNMRRSQVSVWIGIIVGLGFLAMVLFIGMAAFANLGGNEPLILQKGQGFQAKQMLPYFMMHVLGDWHGVPGLVVAALYAAALSTVSSGQNAIAAVIVEDVVCPLHKLVSKKNISHKTKNKTALGLGIGIGVLILALAMAIPKFNSTVLELSLSVQSFITGPLMGLILVGFFFFWVEQIGAITGVVCSFVWAITIYTLRLTTRAGEGVKIGDDFPPLFLQNFSMKIPMPNPTYEPEVYDLSYLWYVAVDIAIVMVIGTIVSLFVHCVRHGRLHYKDMMPPKELRYTMDDFKVAMGCRKPPTRDAPDYEKTTSRMELDVPENGKADVQGNGVDNIGYVAFVIDDVHVGQPVGNNYNYHNDNLTRM